ncbi:MAG: hypothetical protein PHD76_01165 [Methylacidiphilales bacterium]|nr:hypothetical protein [Candidatus Methylacidiphilales bacterium]
MNHRVAVGAAFGAIVLTIAAVVSCRNDSKAGAGVAASPAPGSVSSQPAPFMPEKSDTNTHTSSTAQGTVNPSPCKNTPGTPDLKTAGKQQVPAVRTTGKKQSDRPGAYVQDKVLHKQHDGVSNSGLVLAAAGPDDALRIAKDWNIPGKNYPEQCQPFADELFRRMDAAGVEAYKVKFSWESYNFTARTRNGAHVMVVFKDARGRYYGMDNMALQPVWLRGDSAEAWTEFFAGMDLGVRVLDCVASRAARNHARAVVAVR